MSYRHSSVALAFESCIPSAAQQSPNVWDGHCWEVLHAVGARARLRLVVRRYADARRSRCGRRVLGWQPRSAEDAVVATAESLLRLGLLKASAQDAAPVTK